MSGRPALLRSLAVGRRFLPQVSEHRGALVSVALLSGLGTLLELAKPWPVQWIVDRALIPSGAAPHPARIVALGAAAALVIALLSAGTNFVREVQLGSVGHQVTRALRHRLFSHLAALSQRFHTRHKSGDLLVRLMGDAPMLQAMLVESSVELATRTVLVVGTLAIMVALDPLLAVTVLVALPLLALMVRLASRRIHVAVGKQRRKEGDMADFIHEAVAGTAVIQSLGREADTVRRFARDNRTSTRAGLKASRLAAELGFRVESLLGTVQAAALGLGAWRVMGGHLSPGELLVFMSYVRSLVKPLRAAAKHGERVAKGTACGERILEVLDSAIDVHSAPGAPAAPEHPAVLAFEGVDFAYEPGRPVLAGLDVRFHGGEVVGLFGHSGAGKSTVAALSQRLFDPDRGRVTIDGFDLRALDLSSLRSRYGLCLQDAILFGETVRENLLLGRPDARDDDLWAALRDAGADGFVAALEGGLDARLGSSGTGLSGGQKRRLSLARTLLRRPPILVVDEPFAGLDAESVRRVRETLLRCAEDGIVVVITHDREHLELFDRVVWIDGGRVRATGSHADLLRSDPGYRAAAQAPPPGLQRAGKGW